MSADFWAGYLSGAVGIVIGNPLDIVKVRLQAQETPIARLGPTNAPSIAIPSATQVTSATSTIFRSPSASLVTGTAAPILGYGALNALLFVSYNRTEAALNKSLFDPTSLWSTWIAGAIGGLATWVVSTPTELIKCRAQLSPDHLSSWAITKQIWRYGGFSGLYYGGAVTALRDSVGYGFYFWSYELSTRMLAADPATESSLHHEAAKVLLCGGLAGVATWVSVFPLDVIKTRLQTQPWHLQPDTRPLLGSPMEGAPPRRGALRIAREAYHQEGVRVFFRGLAVCSIRAFIVNAVQWAVYEWMMYEMGQGRRKKVTDAQPA